MERNLLQKQNIPIVDLELSERMDARNMMRVVDPIFVICDAVVIFI